jgi:hypothetical protein
MNMSSTMTMVTLVGRGLGPRVIGMAWSVIDQNLGLQARVMPACCTGGPHCGNSIIIMTISQWLASSTASVGSFQ